jgi:hypothetical protein
MRLKARIDQNQNSIVKSLRKIPGVTVAITSSLGKGFPDLLIGRNGVNYLIELKDGEKVKSQQKLTPDEVQWHEAWKGQVSTCNCLDDILQILNPKQ